MLPSYLYADVEFDQIGLLDGSTAGNTYESSQYFESDYPEFNIASLDNFAIGTPLSFNKVECVIGGWNGFEDPSSISYYETNVYSSPDAAGQVLVGDIATWIVDVADSNVSADWGGFGFLIDCPLTLIVDTPGEYWFSIIPQNDFGPSGQTGIANSYIGDGTLAMQANPGEGFGFGPLQQLAGELAFRLTSGTVENPCENPLPNDCASDSNGDNVVSLTDLLLVISQWGVCGDGTLRPEGDIAPLPNGDCCVNLTDLLAVISDWGSDCNMYGACCLAQGSCIEQSIDEQCVLLGGDYGGDGSLCASMECVASACCIEDDCSMLTELACADVDGYYFTNSTCEVFNCATITAGDECSDAQIIAEGVTEFNTFYMTPSSPQPDEEMCIDSNLNWGNSPDVWFAFTPETNGYYRFSTCDQNSFDTSMVLYKDSCGNQVACNGDSSSEDDEKGCQPYYSSIQHNLLSQSEYYIRIGGWQGETGQGTLNITLLPDPIPGACCFDDGNCLDTLIIDECQNFGGTFQGEETVCDFGVCHVITTDECNIAEQIFIGTSSFNTTNASISLPAPEETACTDEQLNWKNSPDIWMYWVATFDGTVNMNTCDSESFDTSLIIYEGDCSNQIACNGDGEPNPACQSYYSSVNVGVIAGETYYIRVGGWQGTIGEGKITIDDTPQVKLGACCIDDTCVNSLAEEFCLTSGGDWYYGNDCSTIQCDKANPCNEAAITQLPASVVEDWFAGTSASDAKQGIDYRRAEYVNLELVSKIRVFGFQLRFDNDDYEWYTCDAGLPFNVRNYSDAGGTPSKVIEEQLDLQATAYPTGIMYAGLYELIQWEIDVSLIDVEHLSIQSASEGLDCWFLWMNSPNGDGVSSRFNNGVWIGETYDLSICVDE